MNLLKFIKENEGLSLKMYKCPADKWTIGYGHNIEDLGITQEAANFIFEGDIDAARKDALSIFPSLLVFPQEKQIAIIDMIFNMGKPTFLKFEKMIAAIKIRDWREAGKQAKDSKWFKQVGNRGPRVVALLSNLNTSEF